MNQIPREITVYATCWMTLFYPHLGERVRVALERLGVRARLSPHLSCCGWQSYTAGEWDRAVAEADAWIHTHLPFQGVVVPSPVCLALLRHHTRYLFAHNPVALERALDMSERVWGLGEILDILDPPVKAPSAGRVAYVPGCAADARRGEEWLRRHLGPRLWTPEAGCCADGGIFAVDMPELAAAMVARLARRIRSEGVTHVVTDEPACHFHLRRVLAPARLQVLHLIDMVGGEV